MIAQCNKIFLFISLFITLPAVAASFFCTKSNRYVSTGATADQVLRACGAPQNMHQQTISKPQANTDMTIWQYKNGLNVIVHNEKVVGLQYQGQTVGSSMACSTTNAIMIGMHQISARVVCGEPAKIVHTSNKPKQIQEVVWTYQKNPSLPAQTLTFRNGILTSIN